MPVTPDDALAKEALDSAFIGHGHNLFCDSVHNLDLE